MPENLEEFWYLDFNSLSWSWYTICLVFLRPMSIKWSEMSFKGAMTTTLGVNKILAAKCMKLIIPSKMSNEMLQRTQIISWLLLDRMKCYSYFMTITWQDKMLQCIETVSWQLTGRMSPRQRSRIVWTFHKVQNTLIFGTSLMVYSQLNV